MKRNTALALTLTSLLTLPSCCSWRSYVPATKQDIALQNESIKGLRGNLTDLTKRLEPTEPKERRRDYITAKKGDSIFSLWKQDPRGLKFDQYKTRFINSNPTDSFIKGKWGSYGLKQGGKYCLPQR
jgi:hypothetical protein